MHAHAGRRKPNWGQQMPYWASERNDCTSRLAQVSQPTTWLALAIGVMEPGRGGDLAVSEAAAAALCFK